MSLDALMDAFAERQKLGFRESPESGKGGDGGEGAEKLKCAAAVHEGKMRCGMPLGEDGEGTCPSVPSF